MAKRRMFSLDVVDTDLFLDMPTSTQNLYFHLSMRADDDGFISSPRRVMQLANAVQNDMDLLLFKHFIIPFENGVCVIKHRKIHNYIRGDRYTPTRYQDELQTLSLENDIYSKNIEFSSSEAIGSHLVYPGKDRLGKDRLSKDSIEDKKSNKLDTAKADIIKDDISNSKDIKEKEKSSEKKEKERRSDIDELIKELKITASEIDIVYDKTNDRNFGKHILDSSEFGSFAKSLGKTRIQTCISVMKASLSIGYWKGVCAGPMSIYQNYAEVYNQFKTNNTKKQNNQKVAFLPGITL